MTAPAGLRLLVFGGRHFGRKPGQRGSLFGSLDAVRAEHGVRVVIEGEAPGADTLARLWAEARGVPVEPYPADWLRYGPRAGAIRDRAMIVRGRPDAAVGFPGGPGTRNMRQEVRAAGVPLWEPLAGPAAARDPDGTYTETRDAS